MNGSTKLKFTPIKREEEIDFAEFQRRFLDKDWCEANPDHPIAYLRGYNEMYNRLRDKIRTMKPMVMIRRGKRLALIPADCDAARRNKIIAQL